MKAFICLAIPPALLGVALLAASRRDPPNFAPTKEVVPTTGVVTDKTVTEQLRCARCGTTFRAPFADRTQAPPIHDCPKCKQPTMNLGGRGVPMTNAINDLLDGPFNRPMTDKEIEAAEKEINLRIDGPNKKW